MSSDAFDISSKLEELLFPERLQKMEEILAQRTEQLLIVLDGVHHEHNIAAVLRSADAFGLLKVMIIGEKRTFSKGITQGAAKWLELIELEDAMSALDYFKSEGYEPVLIQSKEAAEKESKATFPLKELDFSKKLALIFGSEKLGISSIFQGASKTSAFIPMFGFSESFNISVVAALCMFSARASGHPLKPLSNSKKELILNTWVKESIRNGDKIEAELKARQKEG